MTRIVQPPNPKAPIPLANDIIAAMALRQADVAIVLDNVNLQHSRRYPVFDGAKALMSAHFARKDFCAPDYIMFCLPVPFLVWVSKDICEASQAEFCFALSHELQHVRQASDDPHQYKLGLLLLNNLARWNKGIARYELPHECDADLIGKSVVTDLLGPRAFKDLIQEKTQVSPRDDLARWRGLRTMDRPARHDLASEIRRWLCEYKEQFATLRKQEPETDFLNEFDFDRECQ